MLLPQYYTNILNFMNGISLQVNPPEMTSSWEDNATTGILWGKTPPLSSSQIGALLFELNTPIKNLFNDFESAQRKYNILNKNGVRLNHTEQLWLAVLEKALPFMQFSVTSEVTNYGEWTPTELKTAAANNEALKELHCLVVSLIQFSMFEM